MAAKKTRGKSASKAKMPMKKSTARATKKKSAKVAKPAKRGPQKAAKKAAPKKVAKKAPAKKKAAASSDNANALSRVARVAKEIAHQTTVAVSEGIDKAKEVGGSIVDRVTG